MRTIIYLIVHRYFGEQSNAERFGMRRISASLLIAVILLGLTSSASGGQFYGGRGYLHTNAAILLPPGALDLSFYARGYTTEIDAGQTGWTYLSNGTSALTAAFGFTRTVELGFTQILYQDLNLTFRQNDPYIQTIIPGDTYIRFKIGGWSIGNSLFMSIMPAMRYRVGKYHDIHLEPYESEAVEAELMTAWSYYWKPLYPDEDKSLHFNISYLNHNDRESPFQSSQELMYLTCFIYPMHLFDFGAELYGSMFMKEPDSTVLGREDWAYFTPFVRYKPFKGFQFTMGIDALLLGYHNTTVPSPEMRRPDLHRYPNYSKYRITGRISFSPSTAFYIAPTFVSTDEPSVGRERRSASQAQGGGYDYFDKQDLFRWALEKQVGGVDAVQLDLEKLRRERMKAEEELKELKKKLEEEKRSGGK